MLEIHNGGVKHGYFNDISVLVSKNDEVRAKSTQDTVTRGSRSLDASSTIFFITNLSRVINSFSSLGSRC